MYEVKYLVAQNKQLELKQQNHGRGWSFADERYGRGNEEVWAQRAWTLTQALWCMILLLMKQNTVIAAEYNRLAIFK